MPVGENWFNFAHEDLQMAKLAMKEKIYNDGNDAKDSLDTAVEVLEIMDKI